MAEHARSGGGPAAAPGGLGHRDHLGPRRRERRRHRQQERPGAGEEDPPAGQRPLGLDQRLGGAGGHDAGQRPAREGHRPVMGAGGEHDGGRAHRAGRPVRALGEQRVPVADAPDRGVEQQLRAGVRETGRPDDPATTPARAAPRTRASRSGRRSPGSGRSPPPTRRPRARTRRRRYRRARPRRRRRRSRAACSRHIARDLIRRLSPVWRPVCDRCLRSPDGVAVSANIAGGDVSKGVRNVAQTRPEPADEAARVRACLGGIDRRRRGRDDVLSAGAGASGREPPATLRRRGQHRARCRPFALHEVALGDGLFKEKRERMLAFARAYDERRFLVLFNDVAGRPNPPGVQVPGGWEDGGLLSGHWTGHFMTMLAQAHVRHRRAGLHRQARLDGRRARGVPGRAGRQRPCIPATWAPSPRTSCCGSARRASRSTAAIRTRTPGRPGTRSTRSCAASSTPTTSPATSARSRSCVKMADWAHLALTLGDITHPDYTGPDHARRPQLHVGHLHRRRVRRRERGVRGDRTR